MDITEKGRWILPILLFIWLTIIARDINKNIDKNDKFIIKLPKLISRAISSRSNYVSIRSILGEYFAFFILLIFFYEPLFHKDPSTIVFIWFIGALVIFLLYIPDYFTKIKDKK